MSSLEVLNAYASQPVYFTANTILVDRTVGSNFISPTPTWIPIQQLGPATGDGVKVSYNVSGVANTTVAFNSTGLSQNPLTVTNPSTGVYEIKGILTIEDYNSAVATVNPPVGYTGNVAYSATFTNTNSAAGNFVLSFVGVP
jgi:hypothetical protein